MADGGEATEREITLFELVRMADGYADTRALIMVQKLHEVGRELAERIAEIKGATLTHFTLGASLMSFPEEDR